MSGNYIGIIGIGVILSIALLLSTNRKAIRFRVVGAAFGLQVAVAAFVLYLDWGKSMIQSISPPPTCFSWRFRWQYPRHGHADSRCWEVTRNDAQPGPSACVRVFDHTGTRERDGC